jgi:hypothetical protein
MPNNRIIESADEARAAVIGHNVRYVLLISSVAVIVLFAMAYVAAVLTAA